MTTTVRWGVLPGRWARLLLGIVGVAAVGLLVVLGMGQPSSRPEFDWFASMGNALHRDAAFRGLESVSSHRIIFAVLVLATAGIALIERRPTVATIVIALPYATLVLAERGAKHVFSTGGAAATYPSGHGTIAAAAAAASVVAACAMSTKPGRVAAGTVAGLTVAAAFAECVHIVRDRDHPPSDVVGGVLCGIGVVAVTAVVADVITHVSPFGRPRDAADAQRSPGS